MRTEQIIAFEKPICRFLLLCSLRSFQARLLPASEPRSGCFGRAVGKNNILAVIVGVWFATGVLLGQESSETQKVPDRKDIPAAAVSPGTPLPAAVAVARERAELLHDIYSATLVVIHRHYFHSDLAIVPARAMEDVFENMTGLYGDKAHWISVNTKAMSIDHKPMTGFEKKAVTELSAGKQAYELVENGVYQRAAVIPLGTNCVGCHTSRFSAPQKSARAGLVISIPLKVEEK